MPNPMTHDDVTIELYRLPSRNVIQAVTPHGTHVFNIVGVEQDGERLVIRLDPVNPKPKAGDRFVNGDEPGVLITCETCSGDGTLHVPDKMPEVVAPTPDVSLEKPKNNKR